MIQGSQVVQRLRQIMPGQEAVTLTYRLPGDASTATKAFNARRKPLNEEQTLLANMVIDREWANWQVFYEGQVNGSNARVAPSAGGDKITDAAGVVWEIKKVDVKMQGFVLNCLCLKDLV